MSVLLKFKVSVAPFNGNETASAVSFPFKKIEISASTEAFDGSFKDLINTIAITAGFREDGSIKWKNSSRYKNPAGVLSGPSETSPCIWNKELKDRTYIIQFLRNGDNNEVIINATVSFQQGQNITPPEIEKQFTLLPGESEIALA